MRDKERKYRLKIIQEHHYDRKEQHILDEYKNDMGYTYEEIYSILRQGKNLSYQLAIAGKRLAAASVRHSLSAKQFSETASRFANLARVLLEREGCGNEAR